ncbi:Trifunctional enzyme subunit alpha [Tribonema minus]|uniref:enoyl-CoA hydratase n=1 Tax=Tribonema minus TaxID=303371 RepID=A0A835Z334_9STRA|nr:Trifunctional enzyme subunit alpha [Tribonema minus]
MHHEPESGSSTSGKSKWTYFEPVQVTEKGVAVIRINCPGKMNTVSDTMRAEVERLWKADVESNASIKAVVFISSKPDNFIAGADINMIKSTPNKADLKRVCMEGHDTFDVIAKRGIPTVAAINGACLGGGLEWALHCDYRIATTSKKTVLGLPEVKLGLLPGWGGTQLLRPLVGLQAALDMMLTGKNIRPDRALKMGLVNETVDPASLERVAIQAAAELAAGTLKPVRRAKPLAQRLIEDTPAGRAVVWKKVTETVAKNTGGHYPSPPAIVDCVRHGYGAPTKRAALEYEAQKFSEMAATPQSAALIGLFDGTTALKKNPFGAPARRVETVAVLGAGLMGAGIAQVSCEKGLRVLLKDRDAASVSKGIKYISDNQAAKLKKRRATKFDTDLALSRVVPLADDDTLWQRSFAQADLVIEAVPENLDLKHRVIQQAEQYLPEHCVFATNTSALPIADIAKASTRPQNVIGMHYFSPVPMMPLLEVIPHAGTAKEACAAAMQVGTRQGKTAIVVKDVPGFYVNRCLGPFLVEACALVEAGVGLEKLDKAIKAYGLPVGPLTSADEVGMDVAHHVQAFLAAADLGERMGGSDAGIMREMVGKGMLGRKAGKGFYVYEGKKGKRINPEALAMAKGIVKQDLKLSTQEIQDRAISRFVNEAVMCLQDGIISSPVDGDIGAVFGIGFPPFLGGPFRMLDQRGAAAYADMMRGFAERFGPQFEPCQLLQDMAASGKKFHS